MDSYTEMMLTIRLRDIDKNCYHLKIVVYMTEGCEREWRRVEVDIRCRSDPLSVTEFEGRHTETEVGR